MLTLCVLCPVCRYACCVVCRILDGDGLGLGLRDGYIRYRAYQAGGGDVVLSSISCDNKGEIQMSLHHSS